MSLFIVVTHQPNDRIRERIQSLDNWYRYNENVFLVEEDTTPMELAKSVGFKGSDQVEGASGAVFKLNGSYSGFTTRTLWDWLSRTEE